LQINKKQFNFTEMKYTVISQLELDVNEVEENSFDFDNVHDAKDYYRDGLRTMAETIADFGGDFTISLVSHNNNFYTEVLKRNNVTTSINQM
jgi:signal transduction histidine kinase